MGAIDLVDPDRGAAQSVAAGLQRIGRAGHQVGEPSTGKIFPKYRGDLLEAAVVVRRMLDGAIEETRIPRNPLDVLAQQIVAICAWTAPGRSTTLHALVTRADPFRDLSRRAAGGRAGHALRPLPLRRVRRAAAAGCLGSGHRHHHRAATTRGWWPSPPAAPSRTAACTASSWPATRAARGVASASWTRRWSTSRRVGEVFLLGRQLLAHRGDQAGPGDRHAGPRRARQDAVLEGRRARPADRAGTRDRRLPARDGADEARCRRGPPARRPRPGRAAPPATCSPTWPSSARRPGALPTDRQLVVERFRDELGDWRVCLLSPFGGRVHAPVGDGDRGAPGRAGTARRRPSGPMTASPCACPRRPSRPTEELFLLDPDEVDDVLMSALGGSALFAAALPRERGARAAAPAPAAGPAHAAVDAAPAILRPAGGGQPLRLVPDHPGDLPRGPERRLRRAGA